MSIPVETVPLPGATLHWETMPGHWLLARLGKRVLRPGGLDLTRQMLGALKVGPPDHVLEFGPGLGTTAAMALAAGPASYTGIERDEDAARGVAARVGGPTRQCLACPAHSTGLPDGSATVVYAEAMMSMATDEVKHRIVAEAYRLLAPGGRLGLHELLLAPDSLPEAEKAALHRELSRSIRVGARPLTAAEWRRLLKSEGFEVTFESKAPMGLLRPAAFIRDEGIAGTARFMFNMLRRPAARRRVAGMWVAFRRHRRAVAAIALVATKPIAAR